MTNNFNQKVYEIVKKVPKGRVTTYGQIAVELGNPRWARQVGWALHANKSSDVPCHRVVNREGRLAPNFAGPHAPRAQAIGRRAFDGADEQKRRLEAEGVTFVDPMHVDLSFVE